VLCSVYIYIVYYCTVQYCTVCTKYCCDGVSWSLFALKQVLVVQAIASLLELSVTLFCVLRVLRIAIAQSQLPSSSVLLSTPTS
jgi:hypothetical protein